MAVKHAKIRKKRDSHKIAKAELTSLNKEEEYGARTKRIFFTVLDGIILISFVLSLYSIYTKDYTNTILFLALGTLLLLFFTIRGILRDKKR